jgi:hypothetical protein
VDYLETAKALNETKGSYYKDCFLNFSNMRAVFMSQETDKMN